VQVTETIGFQVLSLRQLLWLKSFSGRVAVLKNANIGAVFRPSLLTELCSQVAQTAAEIEFFSARVDRRISVRLSRYVLISTT
jgi:hypothetical protein